MRLRGSIVILALAAFLVPGGRAAAITGCPSVDAGRDTLKGGGGAGRDRCYGGSGHDTFAHCETHRQ